LNKLITDYAKAHRIPLVDYYSAMLSDKGDGSMVSDYARDAVHPNEKGYEIMEKTLLSSVRFR
jgi:lysophospholipase L1-like esterase